MFLQAALNGARSPAEHPSLPVTPGALAAAAREVHEAGADAVHLHVRAASGVESLDATDLAAVLAAVRRTVPGLPVGISTGIWIVADPVRRLDLVRDWSVLPDFVSVNFDEPGAVELARRLMDRGVGVEAGLSGPDAAAVLSASGLLPTCLRILLEPQEQSTADALRTVGVIETLLPPRAGGPPRLLHGIEATAWPLLDEAARRGDAARIGFEDVLALPGGALAATNTDLVRAARARLTDVPGRPRPRM